MNDWHPPYLIARRHYRGALEVGMVVAWEHAAWEVMHVSEMVEAKADGRDTRCTLRRLYGPAQEKENDRREIAVSYSSRWSPEVYESGRVWLCSCCGHPAPCRMQEAEEQSVEAARVFEKRLKRMGPGICYGCGEVITQRQERVTFPGEHADFPGRGGPTFHTRNACYGERQAYARRARMTPEAFPIDTDAEVDR